MRSKARTSFQLGERKLPFVVENFLMSFSLPNLHFHATTAYDILRPTDAAGQAGLHGPAQDEEMSAALRWLRKIRLAQFILPSPQIWNR